MLNELLAEKVIQVIVNNPTSCGGSFFIVENCLAEKDKVLRKHTIKSIDIITPPKPKHNSTDETMKLYATMKFPFIKNSYVHWLLRFAKA